MKKILKKAFSLFLRGFLTLLPLILTASFVAWVFKFVEHTAIDWVVHFIPDYGRQYPGVVLGAEVITAVVMFLAVAAFGLLVRTLFGKQLVGLMEKAVNAIPGVNTVYRTIRQAVDLFSLRKSMGTMQPVLVPYPNPGIWMVGFMTGPWDAQHSPVTGKDFVTVFIPTTPNPTSGFLAVFPADQVTALDMSTETVLKIILTGGMVKK